MVTDTDGPTRDDIAEEYISRIPHALFPMQEEAILAWFISKQGIMVCAPTGTGKTLIAEAALFEALKTGRIAYYTTPLIALTEQKFAEMQQAAVRWGFSADQVGLVTGNRRVNPQARILVVVSEILLNRLLHPEQFHFEDVSAVVMDEFHNFGDLERGIVWELSLGLLPKSARLLLLSATVGNANEFMAWFDRAHGRKLELVQSDQRRVPLVYQWVEDELLVEHVTRIAQGDATTRMTPALVFCFNRDLCWSVAEQLKGCSLIQEPERSELLARVNQIQWARGAGPKLKQLLQRGVGVHHAGMLPKYRRVVEDLFQKKLLAVATCTETLAAGINLPARSVVMTALVKGPPGKQKLLDASSAQQMFGRAGRPQFDTQGYVFSLAHEDDVRILRWKKKFDAIPEDTKDLGLLKAKKALKNKRPTRRDGEVYWTAAQFEKLRTSPPAKIYSKGHLPWRLLAYMLQTSPEVDRLRQVVNRRLMDEPRIQAGQKELTRMLVVLHQWGFVELDPPPPEENQTPDEQTKLAQVLSRIGGEGKEPATNESPRPVYLPQMARPTDQLAKLIAFRSIHPLYAMFLYEQFDLADECERIQAMESILELPTSVLKYVRVPWDRPAGRLQAERLDHEIIARGLMPAPKQEDDEEQDDDFDDLPPWERNPSLAAKIKLLFDALHPEVGDVNVQSVWGVNELLSFNGNFENYIRSQDLVKQEGILFRHFLRFILLCGEMAAVTPNGWETAAWQEWLRELSLKLTETCRDVDPNSTDDAIEKAHAADVVEGESAAQTPA